MIFSSEEADFCFQERSTITYHKARNDSPVRSKGLSDGGKPCLKMSSLFHTVIPFLRPSKHIGLREGADGCGRIW